MEVYTYYLLIVSLGNLSQFSIFNIVIRVPIPRGYGDYVHVKPLITAPKNIHDGYYYYFIYCIIS